MENKQILEIQEEINSVNDKYLANAIEIFADFNKENETKNDYKGRQIYELMQNADDCHYDLCEEISIKFILRDNDLIVLNNGLSFDSRGVISLLHPNASSKHKDTIGYKGLGFRSLLNWSTDISIYTTDFNVHFSEERSKKLLDYYKNKSIRNLDELEKIDRVAILSSATVDNEQLSKDKYLETGYATAIVLKCSEDIVKVIQKQLSELQFEELLFLKHITNVEIITPESNRTINAIKENVFYGIEENGNTTWWRVWSEQGELLENSDLKKYEISIAYNDDAAKREEIRQHGFLYSFFKTEIPMPLPFLVHGTFVLNSERNKLDKDNNTNELLLNKLIDFIIDKSVYLASGENEPSYEALKFAIPCKEVYYLDSEYHFSENLKNKIKQRKVFPSISGKYISLEDEPKYSDLRFDSVLNKNTFWQLLVHCDDKVLIDFIKTECKIPFYDYVKFCELANNDADSYIANETNADIIKLYCDEYSSYSTKYGPYLLSDLEGNRICDVNTKVFNNPTNSFSLPSWSKMRFINKDLEERLSNAFGVSRGRDLVHKLALFNVDEYSFDRVVRELNNQCDSNDKVIDLLKWLYQNWIDNNQNLQSSLTNIDIKLITRDGKLQISSKCYFGTEYGNEVGERLLTASNQQIDFVASQEKLGLSKIDTNTFCDFLKFLGVAQFPKIESVKLPTDQCEKYLLYNSKEFEELVTDRGEKKTCDEFTYRLSDLVISIDSVVGIEDILNNCEFDDIVYWILKDSNFYSAIVSRQELNNASSIKGTLRGSYVQRTVNKFYMRSYLNMILTETDWIPTKSGIKTNCTNLVFSDMNLSPVVETIEINYEKINRLMGNERYIKNEINAIFEKLGVVDDFSHLSKEKIYEILYNLSRLDDKDHLIGKNIYSQLNANYESSDVSDLILNNKEYDHFKKDGLVLAKQNGKMFYLPHDEVYYVDNKIFSGDVINYYPTLVLSKRAGKLKIEKMFCVKAIDDAINAELTNKEEHPLDKDFQEYYLKLMPYIYSKRVSKDGRKVDFNNLRRTKVSLVKNALVKYSDGSTSKDGHLTDYELIYSKNNAVIKVPENVRTLSELKSKLDFRTALAEVITTIFKVEADKDSFMTMISLNDFNEIEKYLRGDDENLVDLNKSKELFGERIDFKHEFWNTLSLCLKCDENELLRDFENALGGEFDYKNPDPELIIVLFNKLGVDLSDYNYSAYTPIHIDDFFNNEFCNLKNCFRDKYLLYKANELLSNGGSKDDFIKLSREYDYKDFQFDNSVSVDVKATYERLYGVKISILETQTGDINAIINQLIEKPVEQEEKTGDAQNASSDDASSQKDSVAEIDYVTLNNDIAEVTDNTILEGTMERPEIMKRHRKESGNGGHGRTFNSDSNKKNELIGFIAESKVYNTLLNIIGDKGTIEWLSSNGVRAHKCTQGDDTLGYDIKYVKDGIIHYAEVKGTTGKNIEFKLTKNEYEFGDAHKNNFEVWFVFVDEDQNASQPIPLGNIFKFENDESFFNNSRFSVEQSEFTIKAKLIK